MCLGMTAGFANRKDGFRRYLPTNIHCLRHNYREGNKQGKVDKLVQLT